MYCVNRALIFGGIVEFNELRGVLLWVLLRYEWKGGLQKGLRPLRHCSRKRCFRDSSCSKVQLCRKYDINLNLTLATRNTGVETSTDVHQYEYQWSPN